MGFAKQFERAAVDVARFRGGDRREFHVCFETMYEALVLFTVRYTDSLAQAEDCVQEAFISLWENHSRMESFAHIRAFLYRVCHNRALNVVKHEKRITPLWESLEFEDRSADFIENMIREESSRLLALLQQSLPPKCSEVFRKAVLGVDNPTIARELGISRNSVKTHKKIAYKRMKELADDLRSLLILI